MAPLACGYLTGLGTVLNALRPPPASSIAIVGMGAVGLSAMFAAQALAFSQILAVDI